MALSVNKVQLIGYVGGDPTTHVATSGTAITNFSLATGESWTDRNTGKRQERTEWHRVTCFGKIAEIIAQYAKKGAAYMSRAKTALGSGLTIKGLNVIQPKWSLI